LGNPLRFRLTAGQRHDITQAAELVAGLDFQRLIADRSYDADAFLASLQTDTTETAVPPRKNRKEHRDYDRNWYLVLNMSQNRSRKGRIDDMQRGTANETHPQTQQAWSIHLSSSRYARYNMTGLSEIIKANSFTPADLPEFEGKLFFEGDRRQRYLVRFAVLMFLSTVIASGAVVADSTATVIGAMLIAPLMTPIVATTAALVMGNGKRAWQSLLLVISGAAGVILVSMVFSLLTIEVLNFASNAQITSRVNPGMTDLVVALAAGVAGAFAISRDDVADSLPGVAIAIALVPPLCVVGISLGKQQWLDAWGALLLFLTNFLSILLAGGAVFALMGLQKVSTEQMSHVNRRKAYQIIALGVVLVSIPLALSTLKVARESVAQLQTRRIADEWVGQLEGDYIVSSVLVSNGIAEIIVTGPEVPATISDLGEQIEKDVSQVDEVNLLFVPSKEFHFASGEPG
jgi:uncharacterized hydrophobic protein (TIGR00271 family)